MIKEKFGEAFSSFGKSMISFGDLKLLGESFMPRA